MICAREGCYELFEDRRRKFCSAECMMVERAEQSRQRESALPGEGKLFDVVLSLEWLKKPLRAV